MSHDSTRSGNSKRTRNSFSSNKKQKTLGAAWGSNSLSSSRSSFRSAPFSDFGSYMAVKNKKLHDQFDAEASSSSFNDSDSRRPIFQGVSIFVDGFTIPSSQELRGYMLKHGGRFENYFSRHRVTHIICSNLPDSKIKNIRSFSGGLPVVKPNWIVECVAAGKLLSWVPYQLDQLAGKARKQPKLSAFFSLKSGSVSGDVSSDSTCPVKSEAKDSFLGDGALNYGTSSNADEQSECIRRGETEMKDVELKHTNTIGSLEYSPGGKELTHSEKEIAFRGEIYGSSLSPSTSANNHDFQEKAIGESSSSFVGGPLHHRHSTLDDPNFVENYFKNSRLHFIGTWRNRYRKRFGNLSDKVKITNSDFAPASSSQQATIIHVDMDCFFVAVVIRNRQDLMDKPVAVCHSDSARGTAEISSANYPARDYGVRAGMFVRDAKARCPHLQIVPYNFEAYEEVADQFYNILHRHCNKVQAVSCDEAFLDVTDSDVKDPVRLASIIRKEIYETTGCTASAGIGGNLLMARLATTSAKPDGQCKIPLEKVDEYLLQLPVKALPGIGRVLEEKLKRKGVQTCGQLRMYSKESLQKDFGFKTGEMLWNHCRGVDNRLVGSFQESKSVGAEVNWGVRFKDKNDSERFLLHLCKEVSLRLQGCGVQGRTITLKIKKRRKDADEPAKYMGCGDCENLSHSTTVPIATDDVEVLQRITMQLFGLFHTDVKDIRGIGLQVTKLESADDLKKGHERNSLRSWLASRSVSPIEHHDSHGTGRCHPELDRSSSMTLTTSCHETSLNQIDTLPSMEDLDLDVVMGLPSDLFSELNDSYGGKLNDLVSKRKSTSGDQVAGASMVREIKGEDSEAGGKAPTIVRSITPEKDEVGCSKNKELDASSASAAETATLSNPMVEAVNMDLMPSSLSQVDISVLRQLPEELRADIVEALPAHRQPGYLTDRSISVEGDGVRQTEYRTTSMVFHKAHNIWAGDPPYWVNEFKSSSCLMLNILAEMFLRSGSRLLSSTLQCCLSRFEIFCDVTEDVDDIALNNLCELLRHYIQLKLEVDIEELYVCFRLLKRLTKKSKAIFHAYDVVLPHLQASIGESYGGSLHLPSVQ